MDPIERWIGCAGPKRVALLEPLRVRLLEPIGPPDDAAAMIEPLSRLVCMEDPPAPGDPRHIALAREWGDRFGFGGESSRGTGRLGEAEALLIHLGAAGLVETGGRILRPTERLVDAARDPVRLWELAADSFLTSHSVFASQPELALAQMARRTLEGDVCTVYRDAVMEAAMIEARPSSLAEIETVVGTACALIASICRGLRMTAPDSRGGVAGARLSPGGLRLALRALRAAALSDERYMSALDDARVMARN